MDRGVRSQSTFDKDRGVYAQSVFDKDRGVYAPSPVLTWIEGSVLTWILVTLLFPFRTMSP